MFRATNVLCFFECRKIIFEHHMNRNGRALMTLGEKLRHVVVSSVKMVVWRARDLKLSYTLTL